MRTDDGTPRSLNLCDLFEARLPEFGARRAIGVDDDWMTFAELDRAGAALADRLVGLGVLPGDFVAISLPRSVAAVVGILATWKVGAAYVPVDPAAPSRHREFVLHDSGAVALVEGGEAPDASEPTLTVRRLDAESGRPDPRWRRDEPAWVLYTSGSTGRPKGVVGSHRGSLNRCQWLWDTDPFGPDEVAIQNTALTVVDSVWEIWAPLCEGVPVVIAPDDASRDVDELVDVLARNGVTRLCLVPSLLRTLLNARVDLGTTLAGVRTWVCSGEALDSALVDQFHRSVPTGVLLNQYGLTESCADVTSYDTRRGSGEVGVPIGTPITGASVHVLDADLRPVPPGETGELCLTGAPVALGYVNVPDLDAQRFVDSPDLDPDGGRLLRTGDLVRARPDGVLEHLGRIDRQVKIRGHRVEPEGVEAVLHGAARVRAAAVRPWTDAAGRRLAAYVVPVDPDDPPSPRDLRAYVAARLPRHAVPASFDLLERFPLTSSGKIDYLSLPVPRRTTTDGSVEPRTDTERAVAARFRDTLDVPALGVDDDFFELGGESLLAMQLVARVNAEFGAAISVRAFVANPTVAGVAALLDVDDRRRRPPVSGYRAPVAGAAPDAARPLSATQRAMWLHERSSDVPGLYNIWTAVRVSGALDVDALERSANAVVDAHESLRMAVVAGAGAPVHAVVTHRRPEVRRHDAADLDEAGAMEVLSARAHEPFDLTTGPLLRVDVLSHSRDDHRILVTVHHIACDGGSLGVLVEDLSTAYRAEVGGDVARPGGSVLPTDPVTAPLPGDGADRAASARFDAVELMPDSPVPGRLTRAGRTFDFELDARLADRVRHAARRLGATPFVLAFAAFTHAIRTITGEDRFVVGVPGLDRPPPSHSVGCFMRTLQVNVDLAGAPSTQEVVARLQAALWSAMSSEPVPDEVPGQSGGVVFAYDDDHGERFRLGGPLRVSPLRVAGRTSKVDLSLYLDRRQDTFAGRLEYLSPCFDDRTVSSFAKRFALSLERFSAEEDLDLRALPLLTDDDHRLLDELNSTKATHYPLDRVLHELISEHIALTPDAIVACGSDRRTHAEVDAAADLVARGLAARGLGRGDVVGVHLQRSVDLLVAILGVMKAGCAYLPLEPAHPDHRLETYVSAAAGRLVVTDSAGGGGWPRAGVAWADVASLLDEGAGAPELPGRTTESSAPVYVIFTSGSTGQPKGVVVPHAAVVNHVTWMREQFQLDTSDCVLLKTSIGFDVSVWELFVPFLSGSRVEIAAPGGHLNQAYLVDTMVESGVTTAVFVPSALQLFLDHPASRDCRLRRLWVIGEPLPPDLASRATGVLGAEVHNLYGPTEAAVAVTWWSCPPDKRPEDPVFIGRPIANTECLVIDDQGRRVPVGAAGELWVGGVQVATGYVGNPDLTRQRFPSHPERPLERVYRTGDVVRWRWDGELEYLGRVDDQLKVAGVRVEPGEIEVALRGCPGITDAVVLPATDSMPTFLVAFVLADGEVDSDGVRAHVAGRLPAALVPKVIVPIGQLPRLSNGKVDRHVLRALRDEQLSREKPPQLASEAPVDVVSGSAGRRSQVLALWEWVTGAPPAVGRAFIESGGDSMAAVRLALELGVRTGVEVSPHVILDATSADDLVAAIDGHLSVGGPSMPVDTGAVTRQPPDSPTSPIQERWLSLAATGAGHIDILCEVSGPLDPSAFTVAVRELARRHAILRSVYEPGQPPVQRLVDDPGPDPVVRRATPDTAAAVLAEALHRSLTPFDVTSETPFALDLVSVGHERSFLVGRTHHIAGDGWSTSVLLEDFERVYAVVAAGGDPRRDLPPAPQYGAFAEAQRRYLAEPRFREVRRWWQGAFEGAKGPTTLPGTSPPVTDHTAAFIPLSVPSAGLRAEARRHGCTVFMLLVAAFAATLRDATGEEDLVFGTTFAGRNLPQSDQAVGVFVNPLPVRIFAPEGASALDLASTSRTWLLDAGRHQDYYVTDLVRHVEPFVGLGLNDIFDAHIVLQNFPPPGASGERRYDVLDSQDLSRPRPFDIPLPPSRIMRALELIVFPHGDELCLVFGYKPARIPAGQAATWTEAFQQHLAALAAGKDGTRHVR